MEELLDITDESLARFLTRWYGAPDRPASTIPGFAHVPRPLRAWHELTSQWSTPVTTFNYALDLSELEIEDGKLVFWEENQGCWEWATDIDGDDPIVLDRQTGTTSWGTAGEKLSEFLLQASVFEAIQGAPNQIYARSVAEEALLRIISGFRPLPLPRWRWPSADFRILVGPSLLIQVSDSLTADPHDSNRRSDVVVAAPTADLLNPVISMAEVAWKRYTPVEPQGFDRSDLPDFLR